jgi:hypothetical protein
LRALALLVLIAFVSTGFAPVSAQESRVHPGKTATPPVFPAGLPNPNPRVTPKIGPNAVRTNAGFTTNAIPASDDGSTAAVTLPVPVNFYGTTYPTLFVNTNGNVTFDQVFSAYTPSPLQTTGRAIIAPFLADVDTRNAASARVTYGADTVNGRAAFGVNWAGVGYFDTKGDKLNNFQLVIIDRSDTGTGNFDIEFNYDRIVWETGDASGGSGGLGGSSARVGFSNGSTRGFEIVNSALPGAFLDSNTTTGLTRVSRGTTQLGRQIFAVRGGNPGSGTAATPGQYRPTNGFVYVRNTNDTGFADAEFFYGTASDIPVAGDWDGNGTDTIGIFRAGQFFLRNSNTTGFADIQLAFGTTGDVPIAGDWDGDGIDTIGLVRGNTVFLRNSNTTGVPDVTFVYGSAGDIPIAGDWNGDGIDTIGLFRPTNGFVYLRNTNTTGVADVEFFYGIAGDRPVAGDWNGDNIDTIGIVRGNQWFLRNTNTTGFADINFAYGTTTDLPIVGDWNGLP